MRPQTQATTPTTGDRTIVVVSGLPRSGTSMMMAMLAAGGMPLLHDGRRAPDESNPGGYFEDARAANTAREPTWLAEAAGAAVKLISFHLYHAPPAFQYQVLFMERPLAQILASQQAMLQRRGHPAAPTDSKLAQAYTTHLRHVKAWLAHQEHMDVCYIDQPAVIADPAGNAARVQQFLHLPLDTTAMAQAVNPRWNRHLS